MIFPSCYFSRFFFSLSVLVALAVHLFSCAAALHPEKDEPTPILTSKKGTSGLGVRNWVGFIEFRDPSPPQKNQHLRLK